MIRTRSPTEPEQDQQLGMQYTFVTRCFETRFSQHFMLPLTYVNAINATKYFFPAVAGEDNTKGLLMRLAYEGCSAAWALL